MTTTTSTTPANPTRNLIIKYREWFKGETWDKVCGPRDRNKVQPDVIPRRKWLGLTPVKGSKPLELPVMEVILTHTDTDPCQDLGQCLNLVRSLQFAFMRKGWFDIPYNFLIAPDGAVFEGRGWALAPDLPTTRRDLKKSSMVIARIGPKLEPTDDDDPNKIIFDTAAFKVIDHGVRHKYVDQQFSKKELDPWFSLK